jgi:hypothetical protein
MRKILFVTVVSLAFACAAAAAIPFERAVTVPTYGPAPGSQSFPAVATNGNAYLVVWQDAGRAAMYAARISADGVAIDPTGLYIGRAFPSGGFGPFVFWAGDAYVVFWNEAGGLHSARIDGDGFLIDPPHTAIAPFTAYSMATNGSRFVASNLGRVAVLDVTGRGLGTDLAISGAAGNVVKLASNGRTFLASWLADGGPSGALLYVMPFDELGRPSSQPRLVGSQIAGLPLQASNGNEYLLLLRDRFGSPPFTQRFTANGDPIDIHPLFQAPPGSASGSQTLTWIGSQYLYTFSGSAGTFALHIDATGGGSDQAAVPVAPPTSSHAVSSIGQQLLLAWTDGPQASADIKAEVLNSATLTQAAAPIVVSWSAREQLAPRIAFSGRNYLIVWEELGSVRAARMDPTGRSLDLNGLTVTSDPQPQSSPRVVFDGAAYVVSWLSGDGLRMNRIDPDSGALLNGNGVGVTLPASSVCNYDLATDGTVTMLAFSDCKTASLQVMRVNRSLLPLDVPLTATPSGMATASPSIAWSGSQWLVAFQEVIPLPILIDPLPPELRSRGNIRAVRISSAMTPLDTQPIVVAVSDADFVTLQSPHAASSGDDYLIAWTRGLSPQEVRARHVLPNGNLGTSLLIGPGTSTSTVWAGTAYAIGFTSPAGDVVGTMLGKIGDTVPDAMFKISATTDIEGTSALIAANGRLSAAYTRAATESLYGGVFRVFVRDARPLHGRVAAH